MKYVFSQPADVVFAVDAANEDEAMELAKQIVDALSASSLDLKEESVYEQTSLLGTPIARTLTLTVDDDHENITINI